MLLLTMKLSSAASLLLGLLFAIITLLFIVISILLIYSLLMISVETKTFETGVLRMVGLSKGNCISMIIIQSFLFVIPSIICGYFAAIPMLGFIFGKIFKADTGIQISSIPCVSATLQALLLGLIIPVISSVLPIQAVMNKQLNESLNSTRSKTKGVIVDINHENSMSNKLPYLLTGFIGSAYGIMIFFVLPLSVLSFNLGLLFEIFFLILVGMIFGLTLISINLQRMIEILVVYVLLFFEKKSMKMLILKNLSAHRATNKMTSIIYSLTLGCIIFIIVSSQNLLLLLEQGNYGNINYGIENDAEK